ncbi:MAG: ATP-binding protein, partial [Desulfofundulus sp.]
LAAIKKRLQALVQWPLTHPELFKQFKLRPPKGILLCGPPGTGKTLVARALARESGVNFIPVNGSLLFSRWRGEAEKILHDVFRKARQASPCLLFFDELDALAPVRRIGEEMAGRLVSQLLLEFDGLEEMREVVVLGATNRIDLIDPALLRPGRFDEVLEFGYPDEAERRAIFQVHLRARPVAADVDLDVLARQAEGLVGSEIESICQRAALLAVAEVIAQGDARAGCGAIRKEHLEQALAEVRQKRDINPSRQ